MGWIAEERAGRARGWLLGRLLQNHLFCLFLLFLIGENKRTVFKPKIKLKLGTDNMVFEIIYSMLASLASAIIDVIAVEVILSLIFTVDKKNGIKLTFDLGRSEYRKTSLYVGTAMIVGVAYFFVSNAIQGWEILALSLLEWKLIPILIMMVGFASLWLAKVNLRRSWNLTFVRYSLILFIVGLALF